jgi:uncharacterized protein
MLNSGEAFLPFLLEDDAGDCRANDWAQGFARGVKRRGEDWAGLLDDEESGLLAPILALAHEHDLDPEMRPYKAGGEYLKFRLNVEFDQEPSDEECLRAALVAAQLVIAAELAKQGG